MERLRVNRAKSGQANEARGKRRRPEADEEGTAARPDRLTSARNDEELAAAAIGLQQTHGNAYVQRLVEGTVVQRQEAPAATGGSQTADRATIEAWWTNNIIGSIRDSANALQGSGPLNERARSAYDALNPAKTTVAGMLPGYESNDRAFGYLAWLQERITVLRIGLRPYFGEQVPIEEISTALTDAADTAVANTGMIVPQS